MDNNRRTKIYKPHHIAQEAEDDLKYHEMLELAPLTKQQKKQHIYTNMTNYLS